MDEGKLVSALRLAEAVVLDYGELAGISVGDLYREWPSEVISGRIAPSRAVSEPRKMVKAYCKFAKAAEELMQVSESLPSGAGSSYEPPAPAITRTSVKPSGPRRLTRTLPLTTAIVPYHQPGGGEEPTPVPSGITNSSIHAPFPSALAAAQQSPTSRLPAFAGVPRQLWDRFSHAGFNPAVATQHYLQQRLFVPAEQQHSWIRRHMSWILCVMVTLVVPRLVCRLFGLIFELSFTAGLGAAWRLSSAAREELDISGGRAVDFLESVSSYCFDRPGISPASSPDFAALAVSQAVTSAVQELAASGSATSMDSEAVERAIQRGVSSAMQLTAAVQAATTTPPAPTAPWFEVPTWIYVSVGVMLARVMGRTPE